MFNSNKRVVRLSNFDLVNELLKRNFTKHNIQKAKYKVGEIIYIEVNGVYEYLGKAVIESVDDKKREYTFKLFEISPTLEINMKKGRKNVLL